ncbi:MAG: hypothetical protein HZA51_17890 [Planctomycetes bacterium]|nr:hypothetical protein [Planctomycetota bacterium]
MTRKRSIERGEAWRDRGMLFAASADGKAELIAQCQLAMLEAMRARPDRTGTTDDAAELGRKYADGGKWRGTVSKLLSLRKVIEAVGSAKSARAHRHRGLLTVWRIIDDARADAEIARLRQFIAALSPEKTSPTAATVGLANEGGNY